MTFKITHKDGFLLGIGGGATRVSSVINNEGLGAATQTSPSSIKGSDTVPQATPFEGLPPVAGYENLEARAVQGGHNHFPAAGTYPYELDYFQAYAGNALRHSSRLCCPSRALRPKARRRSASMWAMSDGCYYSCNFGDGDSAPWRVAGSHELIGNQAEGWEDGAVMLHNNTDTHHARTASVRCRRQPFRPVGLGIRSVPTPTRSSRKPRKKLRYLMTSHRRRRARTTA